MSTGPSFGVSATPTSSRPSSELPRIYILLENPSKSNNLGPIIRCANAFGITTIVAAGYAKCSVEGSHGASKNVDIIACPTIDQAVAFLRGPDCSCRSFVGLLGAVPDGYNKDGYLVHEDASDKGIEMARVLKHPEDRKVLSVRSYPVSTCPFSPGNVCIVLSKERQGLPLALARQCDHLVHVPHVAIEMGDETKETPPLLDTQSCISITLHHFTNWAGYDEQTFQGHKFQVTRPDQGDADDPDHAILAKERADGRLELQQAAEEAVQGGGLLSMFGADDEAQGDY